MADKKLITPNFKAVDKESVARARGALKGGAVAPLTVPENARRSESKKGDKSYARWTEQVTITQAYRGVTGKGLMDVTLVHTIRQSDEPKNNGRTFFAHFYINTSADVPENHEQMNDKSMGAIITLLEATGLMPPSGTLAPALLASLFPEKGKPGVAPSKLVGKQAIAAIQQETKAATDRKTNKPLKNKDGSAVMESRDNVESYLPDVADEDESGEE
jgi:hypothetical protein